MQDAHKKSIESILAELEIDPARGLDDDTVVDRRARFGANEFTRQKPPSFFHKLIAAFREPMILLLLVAGVVTVAVNVVHEITSGRGDFIECVGIFAAIFLSVIITLVMEGRSAKAFDALNTASDDIRVRVIRNAAASIILKREVVVGDVVVVETGAKVPCDGRLVEATSLEVDESALTGESHAIEKDADVILDESTPVAERTNMLYMGSFVTAGSGVMIVTNVGDATEFGQIATALTTSQSTSTPLQEKLARLGKMITILGGIAAALVFVFKIITFAATDALTFDAVAETFIASIILVVAAAPEGLPTIVAISLALNVVKMSKQNALVKKMIACETIGSVNVVCSDKTGTLTENRMTVAALFDAGEEKAIGVPLSLSIANNIAVNSAADVAFDDPPKFIGNPTECAALVALNASGVDYRSIRENAAVLHAYPFSSEMKKMTTIVRDGSSIIAYTKGSPEKIIAACSLDAESKAALEKRIAREQERARRVIAFAHRIVDIPSDFDFDARRDDLERDMVFDGFAAIADPVRKEVYDAVTRCRDAGIRVMMLTGDNLITARAIANDLALFADGDEAVEAREIESLTDGELKERLPRIRVIARSVSLVKRRVVNLLKELGNVVAVTGDGINDAPALKDADVGLAMGITGTEVSKEASDVVLLDDSFSTIVTAIHWGRGIYENFKRFITFQLTVNVSSVMVILITTAAQGLATIFAPASTVATWTAPFTAIQLLWINIIMDGPPALTLGLEPIADDLMTRRPTPRNASIISRTMVAQIFANGVFIAAVVMTQRMTNFLGAASPAEASTALFTLFVFFQLFNAFNAREIGVKSILPRFAKNKSALVVIAATFVLQVVIVQFAGGAFKTVPLSIDLWLKIIAAAVSVIVFGEIVRLIARGVRVLARKSF